MVKFKHGVAFYALIFWLLSPFMAFSQSGPGGVGTKDGNSDLALWLQADKGVTASSGDVTKWADSSGNGRDATPPSGNEPAFNSSGLSAKPTIGFDRSNTEYLDLSSVVPTGSSGEVTVFMVIQPNADKNNGNANVETLLANDGSNSNTGFVTFGDKLGNSETIAFGRDNGTNDEGYYYSQNISSDSFIIHNFDYDGSSANYYQDNGSKSLSTANSGFSNSKSLKDLQRIGANTSGSDAFDGEIAEIIIYSRHLGLEDRELVANYLDAKYQLGELAADEYFTNSTTHNFQPQGITKNNTTSTEAGGLDLEDFNGVLAASNDVVFIAHENSTGIDNTSSPVRWNRYWKMDFSSVSNNDRIRLTFDVNEYLGPGANIPSGANSGDYELLESANSDFSNSATVNTTGGATVDATNNKISFEPKFQKLTSGNYYTLGTTDTTNSPLPVEFTSFTGEHKKAANQLSWTTASETNAHYFELQRSTGANEDFTSIGRVQASGTTTESNQYYFTDQNPNAQTPYYRLKQVDFDGTYEYSKVIAISLETNPGDLRFNLLQNPVKQGFAIPYTIETAKKAFLTLRIRNSQGIEKYRETFQLNQGKHSGNFPVGNLKKGVYFINFKAEDVRRKTRKLLIF